MIARRTGLAYEEPVRLLPPESEGHFQTRLVNLAKLLGWRRIYHPWSSIHSASGWPDLVLCKPPRLIFAELKKEKGRVTAAQQGWLEDLTACGQEVYCWRPSDYGAIVEILQRKAA